MIYDPVILLREEMIEICESARIDSYCKIEGGLGVYIGDYVHISSFSHLNVGGGKLTFSEFSGCSSGVRILSAHPDFSYPHISPVDPETKKKITYHTFIGRFVVIGAGAIINPGVRVGDGAVIGSGAVVTHDVDPWTFVVGNPAKFLKHRHIKAVRPQIIDYENISL